MIGHSLQLLIHPMFVSGVVAWLLAQCIKAIVDWADGKAVKRDFLWKTGGMPSSHASFMMAVTTSIFLGEGVSNLFVLALCVSIIIMADAFGLRQQVGHQAQILNVLMREFKQRLRKHPNAKVVLRELVGHSGLQVVLGALLGIAVGAGVHLLM